MVERCKITDFSRCLVAVDLDGTLIKGNTFRIFVRNGLKELFQKGAYVKLAKASLLLFLRKCHVISHRTLKFNILPIVGSEESVRKAFVSTVAGLVNPEVTGLLKEFEQQGAKILLATAAASFYVPWIWDKDYQATDISNNPNKIENRGEVKLKNVLAYAEKNNLKNIIVITDHYHDLPLLRAGSLNILVNPKQETLNHISKANIKIDKIIR